jgi:hypothetical protein
MTTVK